MREVVASGAKTKLLVVGVDGVRWPIAEQDGVAPCLTRLASEGAFVEFEMPVPTLSGPGWATLLTGTPPSVHGVRDNQLVGHRLFACPDLLSRAFYADQTTSTFAAVGWPVLGAPGGLGPVIHERAEQQKAGLHRVVVRDGETFGYLRVDAEIRDFARYALSGSAAPDMSFVYFCHADDVGHLCGSLSEEYREAVSGVDGHVSALVDAVSARVAEQGERWLVAVVTDHGHKDEGGHGGASPEEKAAWSILWSANGEPVSWGTVAEPHEWSGRLLALRG